ncbi:MULTISPECIES: non-ribosomal peptide synthetase [Bacillaceae]|uniref:Carrier domain-containing protein n=1 Tax=Alkalicoccobacillus plakortidis TaxID=444060 RepID=A0A9D5HZU7_9BACI|nr:MULTISPECIES: non-ribosomal peptide synthetase [Bacillaceae]KQL56241.1 hypothetical protein AN965_15080 [Alkalicoccobacillus plakortidis]
MTTKQIQSQSNLVIEKIAKITGHVVEDLEMDMYLEADLGLDSIKMVTLMNELMTLLPDDQLMTFEKNHPFDTLLMLDTVEDIVTIFRNTEEAESSFQDVGIEQTITIANAQYPFFISQQAVSTLSICSSVTMNGQLDLGRLWSSWAALIKRYPPLQAVFKMNKPGSSFENMEMSTVSNCTPPELMIEDIQQLSEKGKEQWLHQLYERYLNTSVDLTIWPLHGLKVIQTGNQQFTIVLHIVHVISDGLSNQMFLKELLEIYEEHDAGVFIENEDQVITVNQYNEVVHSLNKWNEQIEIDQLKTFLKKQGRAKYVFNPLEQEESRLYVQEQSHIKTNVMKRKLNLPASHLLMKQSKQLNATLFEVILATYLKTIQQLSSEKGNVSINIPTGGKTYPHIDASHLFGTFAQNIAFTFQENAINEPLHVTVQHIQQELLFALTNGIDRAQALTAAQMAKDDIRLMNGELTEQTKAFVRSSLKSNLYLSYVGETNFKETYGELSIEDYEAYTCTNPAAIDLVVEKFNGELVFTANYDSGFFSSTYIEQHMDHFLEQLKSIGNMSVKEDSFQTENVQPQSLSSENVTLVLEKLEGILNRKLHQSDLHLDLEFDLGLDSLERIRLIMTLQQTFQQIDRKLLFQARTMDQIVQVIDGKSSHKKDDAVPFHLFVEQSQKTPAAIAVAHHQKLFTYQYLNESSNQLAHYLFNERSITKGHRVGVMVGPGINMNLAMLAVLKTGAAYVPIDPAYPKERIEQIISQSAIEVVITEKSGNGHLFNEGKNVCEVDIDETNWTTFSREALDVPVSGEDVMAVIFTSGSTGKPKGVMLSHEGFMNRIKWHQSVFQLQSGERVAQKTSCCFDVSVWELFWPIMYGGTICPVERDIVRNPWEFADWITKEQINVLHFVPSMFSEFINAIQSEEYEFKQLRWLLFSGEALPLPVIQKWQGVYGGKIGLANLYGPTEASIDVTCHIIPTSYDKEERAIPIGEPIDGVDVYILDEQRQHVATGRIGELYIGGIQVAKGYINNPEQTDERFIPNPFSTRSGDMLYRTGDLGSWREDGQIDYHGRTDSQIKIRGYRVELGEIEAHLNALPNVMESAVLANETQTEHIKLIAYVVGNEKEHRQMINSLKETLPDYMLPHRFIWRDRLPKNTNGKMDRGKLKTDLIHLPLMPAQKWLIDYFDFPYAWTGYTQFVYKRELDRDVFNQALRQLTNQNEALRTVFSKDSGEWKQQILNEPLEIGCDFLDLTGLSDESVKPIMSEKIQQSIKELSIQQWPLWKVVVIKNQSERYHMAFIGHHMISDVITNQLLFKEMWLLYSQLLTGAVIPEKEASYQDFLQFLDEMKREHKEEYEHYWKEKLIQSRQNGCFSLPPDKEGTNDEGSARIKQFVVSKEQTKQLMGKAKKTYKTKMYPLLVAPLYQMLKDVTGESVITVSHRVHGRDFGNGKTFMNTAGNFAVNFPLPLQIGKGDSWERRIQLVKDELEQVPLTGVSYDLIAEQLPKSTYPDVHLTSIRANYLGNRDVGALSIFEMDPTQMDQRFSSATQNRTCMLEFFFFVESGELKLEIEYSKNLYDENTIETYGRAYMDRLEDLMDSLDQSPTNQGNTIQLMSKEMENKVVLITGGGTGIGKAIAERMAAAGAQIIIASRNQPQLKRTVNDLKVYGGNPASYEVDVTKMAHATQLMKEIVERYGQIDVLVNNAGITKMGLMEQIPHEDWLNIIQVNLIGTYTMSVAALPYMKEQAYGKIINLGSDSSLIGYPLMTAYAASKHGVLGLTRSLAEEVKASGIQVNAVCPAFVDTDMTPAAMRKDAIPTSQVAEVVQFLSSERSNGITGEEIKVYGKQDMNWFGSKQIPMIQAMLNRKEPMQG